MNSKKYVKPKRRGLKSNCKSNNGDQRSKFAKGKTNIGAKRVTMLPGFLINGFSSGTIKKTRTSREVQNVRNLLLTDNLQAFMEQKGNLRRSQRILRKYNDEKITVTDLESSCNNCFSSDLNFPEQVSSNCQGSIKSILKKGNHQSIFKDISAKFCKVHIEAKYKEKKIESNELPTNTDKESIDIDITKHRPFQAPVVVDVYNNHMIHPRTNLVCNQALCADFSRKIRISFKKNVIEDCKESIQKEVNIVNAALQGSVKRIKETSLICDSEDENSEANNHFSLLPVPANQWVFSTPPKQKICPKNAEQCQLQPGMLDIRKDCLNLYEMRQVRDRGCTVNDKEIFKKVATVQKTPGPRSAQTDLCFMQKTFQNPWGGCVQHPFMAPNLHQIGRPLKLTPMNFSPQFESDVTFVEEGNQFVMQTSQPVHCRIKRQQSSEENEFMAKKITGWDKMFDFNSQEKNIFDFDTAM